MDIDVKAELAAMDEDTALSVGVKIAEEVWEFRFSRDALVRIDRLGYDSISDIITEIVRRLNGIDDGRALVATLNDKTEAEAIIAWEVGDNELVVDACRYVTLGPVVRGPLAGEMVRLPTPASLNYHTAKLTSFERYVFLDEQASRYTLADLVRPSGPRGCQ